MIVVVIIGVLATLAVYGVRNYIKVSRTAEVTSVVQSIRGAQEAFREETFTYLDVSGSHNFTSSKIFPQGGYPIGRGKTGWGGDNAGNEVRERWAALGVQPSGPVMYGYSCAANGPNTNPVAPPTGEGTPSDWPTTSGEPWYVIWAVGSQDGDDGDYAHFVATSFTDGITMINRTE
jgi:type II secretory pathway pseudopilin PulG